MGEVSGVFERIEYRNAELFEISDVAGNDCKSIDNGGGGDHVITAPCGRARLSSETTFVSRRYMDY